MRKFIQQLLGLILVMGAVFSVQGQQQLSSKFYQLGWDNDVLMMTDYYYTQGMSFSVYHPFFKNNPINLILLKPKDFKKVVYGFSAYQKTYTPKDIKSDEIQFEDRPYAGVLVFTSHSRAVNEEKGWFYNAELDLGVMGPASGAGQVQYRYHDLTENQLPNGWQYQQFNWPVINYNLQVFKEVYQSANLEMFAKGSTRIGTLHDDASVGFLMRTGMMNSYMESLGLPFADMSRPWQLFFTAEPTLTVVGYNGTLMGGWYRNEKIHYIEFSEMNKLISTLRSGVGASYKSFGLSFDVIFQSKEFKSGTDHWYTNARLYISF